MNPPRRLANIFWHGAVVALLLLAFFLRVHRIGEQRVWWDEGWSVWVARFSPIEILRQTGNDVHPPLYFELLHGWRLLSGDSEAGLRLLSAFLGTLAVAATVVLGRSLARGRLPEGTARTAGLIAGLLLAVSRFAVAWAQEIRMYALAMLLAVLVVWAARRVWRRGRPVDMAAYVLATAAGFYTLYLFAPVWAAVNVGWLWVWHAAADRQRDLRRWVGLQLAVVALVLPWLLFAAGGFLSTASATPIRLLDFLHIYWTVLTVGIPVDVAQFDRLTIPALAIFLAALVALAAVVFRPSAGRRTNANARADLTVLLVVLLLPAVIVYFVSLPRQNFYNPPFNPRYLVIFTPFYSIALAWGVMVLAGLARRRGLGRIAAAALPVLLVGYMIGVAWVGLRPYHPGRNLIDDYPSLVATIDAYYQPGDTVILYSDTDWPIFAYHHPRPWQGVPHLWSVTPETADEYLTPIWGNHDAVWLVTTPYSAGTDPQRHIPAWLGQRAAAVRQFVYKDMALTLYARSTGRATEADRLMDASGQSPLAVELLGGGRLTGYSQAARDFKSGDTIHLFLYYEAAAASVAVGLLDSAGQVWGEQAVNLAAAPELARQQVDLPVPPDAPTGRYRFFVRDASGRPVAFGAAAIRQKQTDFLAPEDVIITNRLDAQLENGIQLLGYDLADATALPGETIGLTLYWAAAGPTSRPYKVFTHLVGDVFNAATGNFLWGQQDNEPAANSRPTTTWRAGEVIVDEYAIPVAADAPPGTYQIAIGLYDPVTGVRLRLAGPDSAADQLILTPIAIVP